MGYDTSHHPVDVELITERLVPYLLGHVDERAIDDLVADAVRISRVRYRANAWGLATFRHMREAERDFESHLYVWGRPFFVTVDGTEAIADGIDRYLQSDITQVDDIAREMLGVLDPSLADSVMVPDDEQLDGDDALIAAGKIRFLHLLRRCVANLPSGTPVEVANGEMGDPAELLSRETIWVLLGFAAELRPGWMDRGYVWPTMWGGEAGVELGDLLGSPRPLLGELAALDVDFFAPAGIEENYMVGALAPASNVSALSERLRSERASFLTTYDDPRSTALSFRKLDEAVADAAHRGLAFCEATEIYSGFSGVCN